MIIAEQPDKPNSRISISLVDMHHHIGDDEDGSHRNLNVRGSLSFFRDIWFQLMNKYENLDDLYEFQIPKFKIVENKPIEPLSFLQNELMHKNTWVFDQFVAFPFNDKYRRQEDQPDYYPSNNTIFKFTRDFTNACRMIGWCRLNPKDKLDSIGELNRAIQTLHLRGMKLHPKSDDWDYDDYFYPQDCTFKKLLREAVKLNIPVILDCRNRTTLGRIIRAVDETRQDLLRSRYSKSFVNSRLKVIIAHVGFYWKNSNLVGRALSHPNLYGDLTGQHDSQIKELIEYLIESVKPHDPGILHNIRGPYWSKKVMMGSDFNYLQDFHITTQLLYFMSKEYFRLVKGDMMTLHNIFSGNIRRLLNDNSEYNQFIAAHDKKREQGLGRCEAVMEKKHLADFLKQVFMQSNDSKINSSMKFNYCDVLTFKNPEYSRLKADSIDPFYTSRQMFFKITWNAAGKHIAGTKVDRINQYYIELIDQQVEKEEHGDQKLHEDGNIKQVGDLNQNASCRRFSLADYANHKNNNPEHNEMMHQLVRLTRGWFNEVYNE